MVDAGRRAGADWGFSGIDGRRRRRSRRCARTPGSRADALLRAIEAIDREETVGLALVAANVAVSSGNVFVAARARRCDRRLPRVPLQPRLGLLPARARALGARVRARSAVRLPAARRQHDRRVGGAGARGVARSRSPSIWRAATSGVAFDNPLARDRTRDALFLSVVFSRGMAALLPRRRAAAGGKGSAAQVNATPRNAPCPCGSGRRYKECHGALASPVARPAVRTSRAMRAPPSKRNDLARARAICDEVLRETADHPYALELLAQAEAASGNVARALRMLLAAVHALPRYTLAGRRSRTACGRTLNATFTLALSRHDAASRDVRERYNAWQAARSCAHWAQDVAVVLVLGPSTSPEAAAAALQSIVAQSRPPAQLVVSVVEHSPAARFVRARLDLLDDRRALPRGHAATTAEAWNRGVRATSCAWVAILEPPARFAPSHLATLVDLAGSKGARFAWSAATFERTRRRTRGRTCGRVVANRRRRRRPRSRPTRSASRSSGNGRRFRASARSCSSAACTPSSAASVRCAGTRRGTSACARAGRASPCGRTRRRYRHAIAQGEDLSAARARVDPARDVPRVSRARVAEAKLRARQQTRSRRRSRCGARATCAGCSRWGTS